MAVVVQYGGRSVYVPVSFIEVEDYVKALTQEERAELARGPLDHLEGCRVCRAIGFFDDVLDETKQSLIAYHNCADIEGPCDPATQQARCFCIYALASLIEELERLEWLRKALRQIALGKPVTIEGATYVRPGKTFARDALGGQG